MQSIADPGDQQTRWKRSRLLLNIVYWTVLGEYGEFLLSSLNKYAAWHQHLITLFDPFSFLQGPLQDNAAAKQAILAACATRYAQQSNDYMADLAKVHAVQRGWRIAV